MRLAQAMSIAFAQKLGALAIASNTVLLSVAGDASEWKKHIVHEGTQSLTAIAGDFTKDCQPDIIANAGEKTRLEKELKEAESHIQRLEKLLASDFASKAPEALVQKERGKLESYKDTAQKIRAQLK